MMEKHFLKIPIGIGGVLPDVDNLDSFVGSLGGCYTLTDCIGSLICVTFGVAVL